MSWSTPIRNGLLYRRAWAFQEALLATRIVHFQAGGLVWECQTLRRDEGALPPYPSTVQGSLGNFTEMEKWHVAVKAYSRRKLTRSSDRLPALSGVAREFAERRPSVEYRAGLWSDTFYRDLVWQIMPGAQNTAIAIPEYVAPSWSWASVERGVVWTRYQSPEPLVHPLHVACPLKSTVTPFGEVGMCAAFLRGRLTPCRVRYDASPPAEYFASHSIQSADGLPKFSEEKWFMADGLLRLNRTERDEHGEVTARFCRRVPRGETTTVESGHTFDAYFLPVLKTGRWEYDHVGLILSPYSQLPVMEDGVQVFVRVGCISNLASHWFDSGEETGLLLV